VCLSEHHPSGLNPFFGQVFQVSWSLGYEARALSGGLKLVTPADVNRSLASRRYDGEGDTYVSAPRGYLSHRIVRQGGCAT